MRELPSLAVYRVGKHFGAKMAPECLLLTTHRTTMRESTESVRSSFSVWFKFGDANAKSKTSRPPRDISTLLLP